MKRILFACSSFIAFFLTACSSGYSISTLSDEQIQAEIAEVSEAPDEKNNLSQYFTLTDYQVLNRDKCSIKLFLGLGINPNEGVYWDGACKNGQATGLGQIYVRYRGVKKDYLIDAGDMPKVYFSSDILDKSNSLYYLDNDYFHQSITYAVDGNYIYSRMIFVNNSPIIERLISNPLDEQITLVKNDWMSNIAYVYSNNFNKYNPSRMYTIAKNTRNEPGKPLAHIIFAHNALNNNSARLSKDGVSLGPVLLTGSFVQDMKSQINEVESHFKSSMVKYIEDESIKKIDEYVKRQCKIKRNVPSDVLDSGIANICNIKKYSKLKQDYFEKQLPKLLAEKYAQQEQALKEREAKNERERLIT